MKADELVDKYKVRFVISNRQLISTRIIFIDYARSNDNIMDPLLTKKVK